MFSWVEIYKYIGFYSIVMWIEVKIIFMSVDTKDKIMENKLSRKIRVKRRCKKK